MAEKNGNGNGNGNLSVVGKPEYKALTREMFISGGKPKMRLVALPEYDRDGQRFAVMVRSLTAGEQDEVSRWSSTRMHVDDRTVEQMPNEAQTRAKVLSWCVLDKDTLQPLFEPRDIFAISERDTSIVSRLYAVVLQLSQVTPEEVESIVKGFPTPLADS